MAYYAENYIKPSKRLGMHHTPMDEGLESSSVTHVKGCPLVDSGSGYLAAATSAAVVNVVGVSLVDGDNDSSAGTSIMQYVPATPGQEFVAALDATIAQTHLYGAYGLEYDSSSATWIVDTGESSSSQKCVTITGFRDAVGTANGLVYFMFNAVGRHYT